MSLEDINIFSSGSNTSSSNTISYERDIKQKLDELKTDPRFSNVDQSLLIKIIGDAKNVIKLIQDKKNKKTILLASSFLVYPFNLPFVNILADDPERTDARKNKNELYKQTIELLTNLNTLSYEDQYKKMDLSVPSRTGTEHFRMNTIVPTATSSIHGNTSTTTTTTTIPNTTSSRGHTSMRDLVEEMMNNQKKTKKEFEPVRSRNTDEE